MRKVIIKDSRFKVLTFFTIVCFLITPFITLNINAWFINPGGGGGSDGATGPPATVEIFTPVVDERIYYLDSQIHIFYEITVNPGYEYIRSSVYIDNYLKGTYYAPVVNTNVNNDDLLVGKHTLRINAFYSGGEVSSESYSREFYITSAIDQQDISDLRIDKLHDMGFGGQGMTICIIDNNLGFNAAFNNPEDLELFHPSIYKSSCNTYREIIYYDIDWWINNELNGFGQSEGTKRQIWEEIAEENSANGEIYEDVVRVHGSCSMSTLVQIAPHARYVYINAENYDPNLGYGINLDFALLWLSAFDRYQDYEVDVISISVGSPTELKFPLTFKLMTDDNTNPVIPVASAGNADILYSYEVNNEYRPEDVDYPSRYENVISVGGCQDSDYYKYFEPFWSKGERVWNFDYIWEYAHSEFFSTGLYGKSISNGLESFSMKVTVNKDNSNSRTHDGVQFWDGMVDGSIEAWFKPEASQYQVGALWLRTFGLNPNEDPSFVNGYMARLYNDRLSIYKCDGNHLTELASVYLGTIWLNQWWHLKFEADGEKLTAWAENISGTISKKLTINDPGGFSSGKPGFSARTNLYDPRNMYIDNLVIHNYDETLNWRRFVDWLDDDLAQSTRDFRVGSTIGDGLDIYSIFVGTKLGWHPYFPRDSTKNFEFTGTSNACPLVAGIVALASQYYKQRYGERLTVYDFNALDDSIFKWTGDPMGFAPSDSANGEDLINWQPAYENKNYEFGFGIIDAYEIYIYIRDEM